ncbi:hypothetical protein TNCV_2150261 [Trichonephila clavipes]|nr:hypothetical protein TNCV_2150261 [Trichonephila clavipes]
MSEEGYELKVTDRMHRIHRFIDIASGKAEYRRNLTSASAVQSIPHSSLEYMVSVFIRSNVKQQKGEATEIGYYW